MIQAVPSSSTRVVQADWVELHAVLRGSATESLFTRTPRADADETRTTLFATWISTSQALSRRRSLSLNCSASNRLMLTKELLHRTSSYGDAYPFSLVERETGWTLSWSGSSPDGSPNIAALGYVEP